MHIYHLFPLEERVWMNFLQNLSNSIRTRPDRRQSPRRLIWSDKLCTRKGHKTDYLTSSTPPLSLSLGQILGIEFFFSLTPTVVWGWWWSSCPWLYPFYFMTRYWVFHGHGRCGTMSTNEFIHSQFYQCDAVHIDSHGIILVCDLMRPVLFIRFVLPCWCVVFSCASFVSNEGKGSSAYRSHIGNFAEHWDRNFLYPIDSRHCLRIQLLSASAICIRFII